MILRTSIVVPTCNDPNTICDVLKDLVLNTPFPILVLDRGSTSPVSDSLYSWDVRKAMESGRIRIIRFEKDRGLGAALQFAIRHLVAESFTHMVTLPASGGPGAAEVIRLAEAARLEPWGLIIARQANKRAAQAASFLIRYLTGVKVSDPNSNLRLYPLMAVQNLSFLSRGAFFKYEVLLRLLRVGVPVVEVDGRAPVSRMVREPESPLRLALAVGLGVWVACTPWIGWQTLIVLALSLLLRLNLITMILASLISLPAIMPFLLLFSVYFGSQWLGVPLVDGPFPQSRQWLWGSQVLGLVLGSALALVAFLVLREAGKRRLSFWGRNQALKGLLEFYGLVQPKKGRIRRWILVVRHFMIARKDARTQSHSIRVQEEDWVLFSAHFGQWNRLGESAPQMIDRVGDHSYELISFFGRLAPFDVGLFRSAVEKRVPLAWTLGAQTSPPRVYRFTPGIPQALQLYAWAEQHVRELETMVRQHPEQWRNLFPFWSKPPKSNPSDRHQWLEDLPLPQGWEATFQDFESTGRPTLSH